MDAAELRGSSTARSDVRAWPGKGTGVPTSGGRVVSRYDDSARNGSALGTSADCRYRSESVQEKQKAEGRGASHG